MNPPPSRPWASQSGARLIWIVLKTSPHLTGIRQDQFFAPAGPVVLRRERLVSLHPTSKARRAEINSYKDMTKNTTTPKLHYHNAFEEPDPVLLDLASDETVAHNKVIVAFGNKMCDFLNSYKKIWRRALTWFYLYVPTSLIPNMAEGLHVQVITFLTVSWGACRQCPRRSLCRNIDNNFVQKRTFTIIRNCPERTDRSLRLSWLRSH